MVNSDPAADKFIEETCDDLTIIAHLLWKNSSDHSVRQQSYVQYVAYCRNAGQTEAHKLIYRSPRVLHVTSTIHPSTILAHVGAAET